MIENELKIAFVNLFFIPNEINKLYEKFRNYNELLV